uniref:Large ribosomal subunit protein mL52 n=1 Tax=Lygus hesperus TaxID=30085 RepID=A0A0A9Z063_LYGHE
MERIVGMLRTSSRSVGRLWPSCRYFGNWEAEPFLRRDVRRRDVLPVNPNKISALLKGPDFTYLDGRPTPYGARELRRMEKQKEYTSKIIQLTREVDMAKATHKRQILEREQEIQNIIDSKFKPKGKKLWDS